MHKGVNEESLASLFRCYPGMEYLNLKRDRVTGRSKGYAYVNYFNLESATLAQAQLNGIEFPQGSGCLLKVLYAADEKARELEHYNKVMQNRLNDLEATHAEEKAKLMERQAKDLMKIKGELERQKELADQQEQALVEKHRQEAESYEAEQKELNNALIQKYETLLSRKEQEAEVRRQNDLRNLVDEHKRQQELAKKQWQSEREEALREARQDAAIKIEELQKQIHGLEGQLKLKEQESEHRRQVLLMGPLCACFLSLPACPIAVHNAVWRNTSNALLVLGP